MPVTMTPQMKTVKNPQAKATAPPRTPVLRGGNGSCRHTEISERRRARTRPNAATWKASVHVEPRTRAATNRTGETVASTTRAPLPWIEDAGTIHSSLNATRPHLPQIPCSSPAAYVTNEVGKACANKVGMGLEDWNMQKDYGFGVFVWSVTEVVGVAIGSQAADDFGAGWGVNGKAL